MACSVYGDFLVKGKTTDGEWVEWNALLCGARESISEHTIDVEIARPLKTNMPSVEMRTYSIEKDTICRFAYLGDSFGERLYEGDIVSFENKYTFIIAFDICGGYCNVNHKVGYHGFHFEAVGDYMNKLLDYGLRDDPIYYFTHYKFCKRIGNIHDKYSQHEKDNGRQQSINAALNKIKGES